MSAPKFDPKELEIVGTIPARFGMPEMPIYNYPCSMKEAVKAAYRKEPYWMIFGMDMKMMTPGVNPDNLARAFSFEAEEHVPVVDSTVPDMFGIEWEFVPDVGGAMVRPGKPFAEDAWELLEKVQWPNPDEWDWEYSAKINNGSSYLDPNNYNVIGFLNGWFERLISMMDFENALMALYDEDQKEAIHQFFDKLTDVYINILGHYCDAYPELDGFSIHDDWGSQKETFFSPALVEEMIVPYMRRVTDYLHSRGKSCELHSCGQNYKQIPNIIKAGWDSWFPQVLVDTQKAFEEYGDQLIIGVDPQIDPTGKTDDEMRALAREFVDKYMQPGKMAFFHYTLDCCTPAFTEELYSYSRKKCSGEL